MKKSLMTFLAVIIIIGIILFGQKVNPIKFKPIPIFPLLRTSSTASIISGKVPLEVKFEGLATGGVSPYYYGWDFDDGSFSPKQSPSHVFSSAGIYAVVLTVKDSVECLATNSITITALAPNKPPEPLPPELKPAKLAIHDGVLCFKNGGTEPIILIGCSRWEALARAKNIEDDWGNKSFDWYENQLIKSGINYVRHGIIPDYEFVRQHCKRMEKAGIIVELTIHNSQIEYDMGNPMDAVDATIDLPNVFYDVHNEFLVKDDIAITINLISYIHSRGGICSAGAWGHSPNGQRYSETFDPIRSPNQIISVHREWTTEWITKYIGHGKPVIRNEYFDRGILGLEGTKRIMRETIEAGGHCQYYGFAMSGLSGLINPDPQPYDVYLNWIGNYCKEINRRQIDYKKAKSAKK